MKWRAFAVVVGSLTLAPCGCGEAKTKFDPNKKFSEEESQKIKDEDKRIEDEESQGKAPKKAWKKS